MAYSYAAISESFFNLENVVLWFHIQKPTFLNSHEI